MKFNDKNHLFLCKKLAVFFKSKGIKYELNTIIQRIKFGYTCICILENSKN